MPRYDKISFSFLSDFILSGQFLFFSPKGSTVPATRNFTTVFTVHPMKSATKSVYFTSVFSALNASVTIIRSSAASVTPREFFFFLSFVVLLRKFFSFHQIIYRSVSILQKKRKSWFRWIFLFALIYVFKILFYYFYHHLPGTRNVAWNTNSTKANRRFTNGSTYLCTDSLLIFTSSLRYIIRK